MSAAVVLAAAAVGGARAERVTATEGTLAMPYWRAPAMYTLDPSRPRAMHRVYGTERLGEERTFGTVVLENAYVRVEVVPEVGGAIRAATFKATGDDFFFREDKAKSWVPYWESGVKASFPFREHGIDMENQPASWRVVRRDDGSVALATWMEFSRFGRHHERWIYGRHSNLLLSQRVTLRPGEASVAVTCRIVNPAPYKQGRRLWCDILWPREHLAEGAVQGDAPAPQKSEAEWVFPVAWVSSHSGQDLRAYDETETRLGRWDRTMSVFAWGLAHGFAGMWYPTPRVNRLVVFDPAVSPGAKQWFEGTDHYDATSFWPFKYNLVELWVGSDTVFEGVEHWLGPGEAYEFTHRHVFVRGMGKADFANGDVAVNVEFAGAEPAVEAVTTRAVERLEAEMDGRSLGEALRCGPARPARFAVPGGRKSGRLVLRAGGRTVLDEEFPLEVPRDTLGHERTKAACRGTAEQLERNGDNAHFGEMFRSAIAKYPEGSAGRGRLLYRDGYLDAAARCLEAAASADPDDGEAWHLLGAALLELGRADEAGQALARALSAGRPYAPAGYLLAVEALRSGDRAGAEEPLAALLEAVPGHWEARLLRIAVLTEQADRLGEAEDAATEADLEDPADPRLAYLRWQIACRQGNREAEAERKAAWDALMAEPGAKARLEEFKAAALGEYRAPKRLGY